MKHRSLQNLTFFFPWKVGFCGIFWYFLVFSPNHEKYNQIVNEHKDDIDPIVVRIQNNGIYKQSLYLKIHLGLLGQSLNKLQADNITLGGCL
jgi:hypothetical protein